MQKPQIWEQSKYMDSQLEVREKLALAQWLLEVYDNSEFSNRAAIVLSANAILFASVTFITDASKLFDSSKKPLLSGIMLLTLLLLSSSMALASLVIVNIGKQRHLALGIKSGTRPIFHFVDTIETFKDLSHFQAHFKECSTEDLLDYSLSELWIRIHGREQRYNFVRYSIQLSLSALPLLLILLIFS